MYTAPLEEAKESKQPSHHNVVATLGSALGIVPVFKAAEHTASEHTVGAKRIAEGYGLGQGSSQKVLAALNAADEAESLYANEMGLIVEVRKLATSPIVQELSGWDGKLNFAEQFHTRMVESAAQVEAARLALAEKFKAATAKPKEQARGGATKDRLKRQADINSAFDRAVLTAVDDELKLVTKLSGDIRSVVKLLHRTEGEWRQAIKDHERLEEAKSQVSIAQEQFTTFMTDEAVVARGLGIDLADVEDKQAQMAEAVKAPNWLGARKIALTLVADLSEVRAEVISITKLKSNYKEKLKETFGALRGLGDKLSAARVKDGSVLDGVAACLADAKKLADGEEWRAATKALGQFWKMYGQAETLAEKFAYYAGGAPPRLLAGTIDAVSAKFGHDPGTVLVELDVVYQEQCEVSRDDWLTYLGIAGDNVKVGSATNHYTTFNNSVPVGTNVSVHGVRANDAGVTVVCNRLFEQAALFERIHATYVVDPDRHHRYWNDGSAGPARYAANGAGPRQDLLDARYQQMVTDMRAKVLEVITLHGRIGRHKQGPKV